MSRMILSMFMSIDGYVEYPDGSLIRPEWSDDLEQHWSRPNVMPGSLLLYGRRAFEQNAPLWPAMAADPKNSEAFRALARTMNELPKVVVSRTLESAAWNATISREPLAETVRELTARFSGDIIAVGGVTLAAGQFRYLVIAPRDSQRIGIPAGREVEGMPEAVLCLDDVLRHQSRRCVAVVADRNRPVARPRPRPVVVAHDVAVRAGGGIVRHVRVALRVHERVAADPDGQANEDGTDEQQSRSPHAPGL